MCNDFTKLTRGEIVARGIPVEAPQVPINARQRLGSEIINTVLLSEDSFPAEACVRDIAAVLNYIVPTTAANMIYPQNNHNHLRDLYEKLTVDINAYGMCLTNDHIMYLCEASSSEHRDNAQHTTHFRK